MLALLVAASAGLTAAHADASRARTSAPKAGQLDLTPLSSSGRHGITITVIIHTEPYVACHGHVTFRGRHLRLRPLRTSRVDGAGRWQWRIARGLPAGTWRFSVACWTQAGRIREGTTLRTDAGPPGRPPRRRLAARGSMHADANGTGSGGSDNPYRKGECTWWAWSKRQDLPFFRGLGGDALNWARSAAAHGFPIGHRPVVGAIAVFRPYQYGAGYLGHVAYVEAVEGKRIRISEAAFSHTRPGHERTLPSRGLVFIYGGPAGDGNGHVVQKSLPRVTPQPGVYVHRVYHTCLNGACGLARRTGPGYSAYHVLSVLLDGAEVGIDCQTTGEPVHGVDGSSSNVWDRLFDGGYVADYYVDTSGTLGAFSPPIPRCTGPNPLPEQGPPPVSTTNTYHVTGTCDVNGCVLNERDGPGFTYFQLVGTLAEGTEVHVACQTPGESVGSQDTYFTVVWDRLDDDRYVSDYYLDTPGGTTGYTDGIARC